MYILVANNQKSLLNDIYAVVVKEENVGVDTLSNRRFFVHRSRKNK